ncbi:matrix metalloproteinase-18-like [Amphiura filiformis]|uniref:matrix metalloproteinase-18-like n=1 Tax=Amphiura filiformis TaxID=82378 RepID=UPI003B2139C5
MTMKEQNNCVLVALILLRILTLTSSAPVQRSIQSSSMNMEDAHRWLKKYGYMRTDNPSGKEVTEAMMLVQQFYGLSQTGELDQDTTNMMSEPRCGVADIQPGIVPPGNRRRRRFTLLGDPWDSTSLSYRFNNYTPDLSLSQVRSAIERALGVWAEVTPLTFTREQGGTSFVTASDIEIVFGSGSHGINHPADSPFDGSSSAGGVVLAHAFNPGSVRFRDLRGDMHFDEDERWQDAAGIDLFTVAAHEFGHSLGLGHSDVLGALMFPTYYGYNANFRLHEDDIEGIQSLYGPRPSTPRPSTPKVTTIAKTQRIPNTSTASVVTETTTRRITTSSVDYCEVFTTVDTVATLYNSYDDAYTIASKRQEIVPFAKGNEILENPFSRGNIGAEIQAVFAAIWEDNNLPVAAMVEKQDGSLVVFRGSFYWQYILSGSKYEPIPGFPKSISTLGLPETVQITAALSVRDEDVIHLFTTSQYWSFDGDLNTLDMTSPKMISSRWPGIPSDLNAAFNWQGNPCFVRNTEYWCFNETSSEVGTEFPRSMNEDWFGCDPLGSDAASMNPIVTTMVVSFFCFVAAIANLNFE